MADSFFTGLSPFALHRIGTLAHGLASNLRATYRVQFCILLHYYWRARDNHFSPYMFFSQVVSWSIIVVTGTVLHGNGVTTINTAADAARALQPLVHTFPHSGYIAQVLFSLRIIGLGLLAIPVLAGSASYAVSESFQWAEGLDQKLAKARGFYGVIIVATLVGLLLDFIGINPIKALVYSAVINGVVAVPLIFIIALIARNKNIMGSYTSGWVSNALVWLTFLDMGAAAVAMVFTFGH
jgi:Mn2+/Fe2+ NRAMP family transporter